MTVFRVGKEYLGYGPESMEIGDTVSNVPGSLTIFVS